MSSGSARIGLPALSSRLAPELTRVVRFCSVGASNTAITLAVFAVLVQVGCPGWVASAIAFAAGAVNGYHWNARWTFADRAVRGAATRLRYLAVQGNGSALSALGLLGAQRSLGLAHLPAELVILPLVTGVTYGLMRFLVFHGNAADQRTSPA
jgi:putative flippase GtrA